MTNRKWTIAITLALTGGLLAARLPWSPEQDARSEAGQAEGHPRATPALGGEAARLPVRTETVSALPRHSEQRHFTGEVRARRSVELGFQVPGELLQLVAAEGAGVEEGDVLARLDTRRTEARRASVVARLAEARAQLDEMVAGPRSETVEAARAATAALASELELARLQTARRDDLAGRDAISTEERDVARFSERTLEARLAASRAELTELENGTREEHVRAQRARVEALEAELGAIDIDLADSELRAPFAGTVAAHRAEVGAVVAVGAPVLRLVESGALEAWVGLPSSVIEDMDGGAPREASAGGDLSSSFALTVDGVPFPARLRHLLPEIDPRTRTRTAIFDLVTDDDAELATRPQVGRTVRLTVRVDVEGRGYWLPAAALIRSRRGLWAAYVAAPDENGEHRVERREVELLHTEGERAFVRGTLFDGDQVLVDGVHRVVPGQTVEITPAAGA